VQIHAFDHIHMAAVTLIVFWYQCSGDGYGTACTVHRHAQTLLKRSDRPSKQLCVGVRCCSWWVGCWWVWSVDLWVRCCTCLVCHKKLVPCTCIWYGNLLCVT